jgi:phosphomannomutase
VSDTHDFHPTLLREYDIRGVVGETLFEADARAIGRAFGTRIIENGGTSVATGRDGRHSSPAMEQALAEGLASTGLTVHRIGGCATPGLYFAVHHLGAGGGVMVTGSHNPPNYNGFKMMIGTGPFFGADIQALGPLAAGGAYARGDGALKDEDVAEAYVARLLQDNRIQRPLSVVWDCGNGAAGPSTEALCALLPGTHRILFPEVDGDFPNHHPDPTVPENLETLIATVAETKADLGIAFDGDGDRIGVVDDKGRILWGDQLIAVLAEPVLAEQPGATIIADVKASQILFDRVAELGGKPEMWRTGHSLIKTRMAETGAPLAGEMSGHIFFKDRYFGFDDALYAAVRLIETLSARAEPLSAVRDRLPEMMNTPELRFSCSEERKFEAVDDVKAWLAHRVGIEVSTVDGVRVKSAKGWWLLRASNTQDVLVARCESDTEAGLAALKEDLAEALRAIGLEPPTF